jgi:hypothetical protein
MLCALAISGDATTARQLADHAAVQITRINDLSVARTQIIQDQRYARTRCGPHDVR